MDKTRSMFLLGCIPTRLFLAYSTKQISNDNLRTLTSLLLSVIGIGFLVIYIFGLRNTGIETGGHKIWWNNLRPVHGVLYLSAAFLLYSKEQTEAWKLLVIDTIIGLVAHLTKV